MSPSTNRHLVDIMLLMVSFSVSAERASDVRLKDSFGLRFQGVRGSAESAKRDSASGRSRDVGLHSDCLVLARASRGVQVVGIGTGVAGAQSIPGTDSNKIKSAIRVRMAGSHGSPRTGFSARLIESRDRKM